jgi:gamma-butyrobetaine dioxygenase
MTLQADRSTPTLTLADDHLTLTWDHGASRFHYLWLRDNCWCEQCRVLQTGERRIFTAYLPADIAPTQAGVDGDAITIGWSDGHASRYTLSWLTEFDYSNTRESTDTTRLWDANLGSPPRFEHDGVLNDAAVQRAYLEAVRDYGAAVVANTPSVDREGERFAEVIGHLRETAFERVHNVHHDPAGYNVAHTPIELKPHTDMPSYHWPPSVQLLHFLVNEATGGESTLVDGWRVLADLRSEHPDAFDVLCRVPVTFQLFSETEDTLATSPLVQLNADGSVRMLRFSNQLALPLQASFDDVGAFYDAQRILGRMIDDDRYKLVFKAQNGDLLTVHSHRVLHGRLSFDPTSGARHLQDVYMEYDDFMDRLNVLTGTHKPVPSNGGQPA